MKIIKVEDAVYDLLKDSASRRGLSLIELLEQIAGREYERQQIESSKG